MKIKNDFGNNLKRIREEKGLSQKDIAEGLHTCRENVSKWERGVISPQLKWVYEIAYILGVNPEDLIRTK
jgi:transcriptional regulator with XRE-family HTH domain